MFPAGSCPCGRRKRLPKAPAQSPCPEPLPRTAAPDLWPRPPPDQTEGAPSLTAPPRRPAPGRRDPREQAPRDQRCRSSALHMTINKGVRQDHKPRTSPALRARSHTPAWTSSWAQGDALQTKPRLPGERRAMPPDPERRQRSRQGPGARRYWAMAADGRHARRAAPGKGSRKPTSWRFRRAAHLMSVRIGMTCGKAPRLPPAAARLAPRRSRAAPARPPTLATTARRRRRSDRTDPARRACTHSVSGARAQATASLAAPIATKARV